VEAMNEQKPLETSDTLTASALREHLKDVRYTPEWLFQTYVLQKRAHIFCVEVDGYATEMEFRLDIAETMGLALHEVNIVGSAQVGFSVKPSSKLRRMDEVYETTKRLQDRSDVDVAVVSPRCFDKVCADMHSFTDGFRRAWKFNAYYADRSRMQKMDVKRVDYHFYQYLARGWIRPDFAPDAFKFSFELARDKWTKRLNRRISFAIYKVWNALKCYQARAFESLRELAIKDQL
jgi:hypothetical protein